MSKLRSITELRAFDGTFSAHALMVFTIFSLLVYEITKLKVLACPFDLLTNFENPFSNPLGRPQSGDFDTENAYRKPTGIL